MSDYLCEELIVEIFTRLPPKSLLRFRSLSKSLCSCISSPGFIRMHTFRSPQKFFFKHSENRETRFYTLQGEDQLPLCPTRGYMGITALQFPWSIFRTVGSCNGTFCLKTNNSLILWNPSIRRKLSVPECPRTFELPKSGIGFGFDPISDDYKIVWISYASKSSFVYAMKTGAWCAIASPTPLFSYVQAFYFNGVLHWEVRHNHIESEDRLHACWILTFDLSTHVFGLIPVAKPSRLWQTTGLTTIHGSLALISYHLDTHDSWIRVWRDGDWSVVFKLGTVQVVIDGAVQLTNNGDLLLIVYEEGLQVYNPKTGLRSRLVDFNAASRTYGIVRCVESLHLLDMGTACETNQQSVSASVSVSGGKKTSKARYLNGLFYCFNITFKPLFNLKRWFPR